MKFRKTTAIVFLTAVLVSVLCSCKSQNTAQVQGTPVIMGSSVIVQTYCENKKDGDKLYSAVIDEIKRLDTVISKNNPESELYEINQNSGRYNDVSNELFDYIWNTTDIYSCSGNKASVTSGALTELWGIDTEEFRLPEQSEIEKALPLCLDCNINVTENESGTSICVKAGQLFNLGSVGKGIACDRAIDLISADEKCKGAVVSVGGSVAVYGSHDGDSVWSVGIRDPYKKSNEVFATLKLENCYVSTSGNYEKKFTIDSKTYHHILDLETGYPVENDLTAVTVVASSGLESDALSTLCYVLGEEASREIIKMYDAEAVFVYSDKTVSVTDSLKDKLEISNSEYTLK